MDSNYALHKIQFYTKNKIIKIKNNDKTIHLEEILNSYNHMLVFGDYMGDTKYLLI